ncbi:MAG: tetratricopeptide repeat protein [Blastocatellia bacterium]
MKLSKLFSLAILVALFCVSLIRAQDDHQHQHHHDAPENLGQVNFPISCSPSAQKQFNRAAALLHSFWYEEAEKTFTEVTMIDPGCAMGYWGIAMSNYHPLWAAPNPAELKRGSAAVEKAKGAGAKTDRERDYIAAIEAFYKDSDKLDHRARAIAYEKAMEQVYRRYPQDREAAIFYALSLLGTALPTDKSYANQKRAAEILNRVLPAEARHPGVAHYIIHSFDYPALAQLALPAARSYAKIAASSPHALHMPSHIFTRLGLWRESIQSNIASAAAAKNHVAKTHPGAASFDQLHAMDYLEYAYLQGAQDRKAKAVVDELGRISKLDLENFAAAYAFAAIPARYTLERGRWAEAAKLEPHPPGFPWNRFPYAEAIIYFARAMGAARGGDAAAARKDVEKLAAIQNALARAKDVYWADQVEIQRRAAAAWLALAEGDREKALEMMRAAAELEDSTEKHPVTPGAIIPAREMLGSLLIELNQPEQALREFENSLRQAPNRFNGLYGAARAAELSGDRTKAAEYYARLVKLCERADGPRPELEQAKRFLERK